MDQLKVFLRQCAKHRFWIAFGISMLLPMVGYLVGSGSIVEATTKEETTIKGADAEIKKYTGGNLPNNQYLPIVAEKKEGLTKEVDATWRRLFAIQEPLLRWPEDVEAKFRGWGRKWPENVDRGQIQAAINDYTIAYPEFVDRVYKTFKPWSAADGTGIVVAPEALTLMTPAQFTLDAPPDLGRVWSEQERLWVVTALLDVVAKVNDQVGAKDWDGAIIKQINLIEVGTYTAQDQKSIAKGDVLEPGPTLSPDGAAAPAVAAPAAPGGEMGMMGAMAPGGAAATADNVFAFKSEPQQQFKVLPIRMTVLLDQAHLPDFLVGLENSPMAIQVMEPEISKPLAPVVKPVLGETSNFGMMGQGGMGSGEPSMGMGMPMGMMGRAGMQGMNTGGMDRDRMRGNPMSNMQGRMRGMGGTAPPVAARQGQDNRGKTNKATERKNQEKEAAKAKAATKSKVDQYFNIIEVTVYGQARFYNAPPAPVQPTPSTAPADAAVAGPTPAPADAPKAPEPGTPKADGSPKAEAPSPAEPTAKSETPAKAEPPTPPTAAPKTDAPAPKTDGATPKS